MPDEREHITIQVAGKSFSIDAPKGLSDDDVLRKVMSADEEFAGLATTNERLAGLAAEHQAKERTRTLPKTFIDKDLPFPESTMTEEQRNKYSEYEKESGKFAAETAGGMAGGALIAPVAKASRAVSWALPTMARAAGIGGGAATGTLVGGGSPKQAAQTGTGVAAGTLVLEPTIAAAGALLRPFLQKAEPFASEEMLKLGVTARGQQAKLLSDAEEGLRKSIVAAPRAIRKNVIDPLYPTITEPVDIYAPAKHAITSTGKQIAHGTPSELYRTKNIGRQISQIEGTLKELMTQDRSLATDAMQQSELLDTLEALKNKRSITFQQAQNLRSALGRAIAKGQGYKIPGEVYQSLRGVHDLVDDGMRATAENAGKLDQWENAQKVYRQFMDDFYNKNAPLKGVLDLKEGMTGGTLRRLTRPFTGPRAEMALRRWGLNEQADALRKVLDNPNSKAAIKDMEQVMTSPKAFSSAKLVEAKEADVARVEASRKELSLARKKRLGLVGGGAAGLYEGYRILRGGPSSP